MEEIKLTTVFKLPIEIKDSIIEYLEDENDLDILGNDIGLIIGGLIKDNDNFNKEDFISGFNHGISLTDGTH